MKSRFIVLLLALIMLVTSLPNTVYAEKNPFISQEESLQSEQPVSDSEITSFPVSKEIPIEEHNRQVQELIDAYGSSDDVLDRASGTYAASYDPRKTGKVTSVKDQGNYGLCWAYAAMATAESSMIAAGMANNSLDLSELHAAYFAFKDQGFTNFLDFCNNGWNSAHVFLMMKKGTGPVYESLAPMPSTITANTMVNEAYKNQRLAKLKEIYGANVSVNNQNQIKYYITNWGGAQLSYHSEGSPSFYKENPDGSGDYSYYLPVQKSTTNHAVEIVGWNDNYSKYNFAQTPAGNGAWLCKNSWGKTSYYPGSTGTGYFWISYYDPTIQDVKAIAVEFEPNTVETTSITLDKTEVGLEKGQKTQLTATVLPENATNKNVTFKSDNSYVASVDASGVITAYNFGRTTIRVEAEDGCSSAICSVNVYGGTFELNVSEIDIYSNSSEDNHSVVLVPYLNGENILGSEIEYTIEDETIAGLYRSGSYCAVYGKQSGTTFLTASFKDDIHTNGETLVVKCPVRITTKATDIIIGNNTKEIYTGDSLELEASVYPEYTSNKELYYSSNNENAAIVTNAGTVIGVGGGYATITVRSADGNVEKRIYITVRQQVEKITTRQESYILQFGYPPNNLMAENIHGELILGGQIEVYPENAYKKEFVYYSLNESVAKVDSTGTVKPVGYGTATIRIQATDGKGAYKDVTVHVKKHVIYEINPNCMFSQSKSRTYHVVDFNSTLDPVYGKNIVPVSFYLNGNSYYADTVNQYLTYSISDPSIAIIEKMEIIGNDPHNLGSAKLLVKIKKPGKVTINIQAKDDLKKSSSLILEIKEDTSVGAVKTIGNATYKIYYHNTVLLTKYTGKEKNVVIPTTVQIAGNNYMVKLANNAFKDNKTITSVTIGETFERIPDACFKGCTSLKTVKISSSVNSIGNEAFYGCTSLKKITLPDNINFIGGRAFANCKNLKSISLSKNLVDIYGGAFMNCTKLAKITIPSKVEWISTKAFYNCKNLKTITIKTKKLKSNKVLSKAFKGIHKKATIKVPASKLKSYTKILKKCGVTGKMQKIKKL